MLETVSTSKLQGREPLKFYEIKMMFINGWTFALTKWFQQDQKGKKPTTTTAKCEHVPNVM